MHIGRLLPVLLFAAAIPALGLLVSYLVVTDLSGEMLAQGRPPISLACAAGDPAIKTLCGRYTLTQYLTFGSLVATLWGLMIPLVFWLAALLAGHDRDKLAEIFPPLVPFALILVTVAILLQGGVLTLTTVVAGLHYTGRTGLAVVKVSGALGLGAIAAAWLVGSTLFKVSKSFDTSATGLPLTPERAPGLFGFVRDLAARLGAEPPQHIVIGLEPTFFVTSASVHLIGAGERLEGETLYISAPMARLMTRAELTAIIGHELGHFRGQDTLFSQRFSPVYAGLGHALESLEQQSHDSERSFLTKLSAVPAAKMLGFMLETFERAESAVSREREHQADEAGAEAASAMAIATSLVKFSLYAGAWGQVQHDNVARLNQGKVTGNLSQVFESAARYDLEQESIDAILAYVADKTIAHPTDRHPPAGERMAWLGVDPQQITKEMLLLPAESALTLVDDAQTLEEQLTVLEHHLMLAMGYVDPPEGAAQEDHLLKTTYQLAAAMVAADGQVDPSEIQTAEAIGAQLFANFDPVDFREVCGAVAELPAVDSLASVLGDLLNADQKSKVFDYLKAIAQADGRVDDQETALLDQLADVLGLPRADPAPA